MNITYYLKELIYNLIIYIFFTVITTFYFFNSKIIFILNQNKNIDTTLIYNFFINIPNQILIKKLDWYNKINNKNIVHIEYYTLETIYYKTLIFYFFIITLLFIIFILCKWKLNISYAHEKKKSIIIYIIIIFFFFLDYYYNTFNTTNIKSMLITLEKKYFYNFYLEPQITMESLLDTKIFFFFFILLKYILIYILFINKIYINLIYRYFIMCFIFFLIHIDFLYIIYNILEIEIIFILLKIVTFYFDGDDRN